MAKKSNEEIVERLDKQEETQNIKETEINNTKETQNIEKIDTVEEIKKIYSLKELKILSNNKKVSIKTIVDLLIKYDNDINVVLKILNNAKILSDNNNVPIDDILAYTTYKELFLK